ncbi:MAG: VOC family protein [Chloroflexi bacterium]|nr:VOC family protein [Chloroflexota bacterium]
MAKIRGLTELVIWVRDMEKALHFYRDALGLTVMSPPDFRGAVFLQVGESKEVPQQIVLVPLPKDAPGAPAERSQRALHHIGLELAAQDFEQERERLQSLGFEVRLGEHPFLPLRGLYIDDPDGNEVELIALT